MTAAPVPAAPVPAAPESRQPPGPPPADTAAALLARVRHLELVARRNAAGLLPGDYLTAILGRGLVFHEARRYVAGEPARSIDWNITARVGEPYVRVHQEERQREVVLAVDVSPSMHGGFQERTKLETAVELAATLAVTAVAAGDRLGWVTFADRVLAESPPRVGRAQLFRVLRALLDATAPWDRPVAVSDPRQAIHAVGRRRGGGRRVVFLISDFVDHDVPDDLRYVQARDDVALLHVFDPLELALVEAGDDTVPRWAAWSPEGERAGVFHPGDHAADHPRADHSPADRSPAGGLRRQAVGLGLSYASVSTLDPVAVSLRRHFQARRGRR